MHMRLKSTAIVTIAQSRPRPSVEATVSQGTETFLGLKVSAYLHTAPRVCPAVPSDHLRPAFGQFIGMLTEKTFTTYYSGELIFSRRIHSQLI